MTAANSPALTAAFAKLHSDRRGRGNWGENTQTDKEQRRRQLRGGPHPSTASVVQGWSGNSLCHSFIIIRNTSNINWWWWIIVWYRVWYRVFIHGRGKLWRTSSTPWRTPPIPVVGSTRLKQEFPTSLFYHYSKHLKYNADGGDWIRYPRSTYLKPFLQYQK